MADPEEAALQPRQIPVAVQLDATGSTDPEDSPLICVWEEDAADSIRGLFHVSRDRPRGLVEQAAGFSQGRD